MGSATDRPMPGAPADRPRIGRRALLAGGALGAGGLTALLAGGSAAGAATNSAGPVVYGPAPGGDGVDDTAALQAALYALPAGGTVLLPPGTYHLAGLLYVPQGVDLRGSGGGYAGMATVLQCTAAGAGVHVWGGGGITGGFVVDGNSVATAPFTRGPEGSAVSRTFLALSVLNSAADGVACLGAQNDAWYLLTVYDSARDGLVFDQGYGGALFSRCEVAKAGRFNVRFDRQVTGGPYAAPSDLVFHQCIFEYTGSRSQSVAYLNGGWAIKFDHTSFFASVPTSGPLIEVLGGATEIRFADAAIQSSDTVGGIGLRVDYGCGVALSGTTHFQNLDTAIWIRKSANASSREPYVDVHGLPLFFYCTQRFGADAAVLAAGGGTVDAFISTHAAQSIQVRRPNPGDLAWTTVVGTNPHYSVSETVAGTRTWGSGSDAGGDVAFGRLAAGVVGVRAQDLLATGHGTTAQRPSAATVGALRYNTDAERLEVSDGRSWRAPTSTVPLPDPVRVYDSRWHDGALRRGQSRTISFARRVPAGATGVIVNLTITGTVGSGFLVLYPAGRSHPPTSSINWYARGQTIANQATSTLGAGSAITVYCGGESTQFIVDLLAYLG